MKSAYELALERSGGGLKKISEEKKAVISEIDKKYKAKIAGAELAWQDKISKTDDMLKQEEFKKEMLHEIASIRLKCEQEKEKVRNAD